MHQKEYLRGLKDGIPVALGYFAVSFTIGIAARKATLTPAQATIMSLTNFTSAGEFAAFAIIASGAPYLEMLICQAVINMRYCLMSCALSQKLEQGLPFYHRLFMAFGVTDEIFGLSVSQKGKLDPWYTYGAMTLTIPGWSLGTLLGVVTTGVLSQNLLNAMNMALFGMFIAVFMPAARDDKKLFPIIFVSMAASTLFQILPGLKTVSSGMRVIILTLIISFGAAVLFPIPQEEEKS